MTKTKVYDHTNHSFLFFLLPLKVIKWLQELGPIELTRSRIASLERDSYHP